MMGGAMILDAVLAHKIAFLLPRNDPDSALTGQPMGTQQGADPQENLVDSLQKAIEGSMEGTKASTRKQIAAGGSGLAVILAVVWALHQDITVVMDGIKEEVVLLRLDSAENARAAQDIHRVETMFGAHMERDSQALLQLEIDQLKARILKLEGP